MRLHKFILILSIIASANLFAQDTSHTQQVNPLFNNNEVQIGDTTKVINAVKDSAHVKPKHDAKKATLRSLILPGWGQAYNREYWKIPLVYGILAIPASTYFYNDSYYKKTKFAYEAVYAAQVNHDSSLLPLIDSKVKAKDGSVLDLNTYQSYRNSFRQNRDYSVLWFIILWGVNIVDATVFGHLKDFDVSDDVSMQWHPSLNNLTKKPQLNVVFNLKNNSHKALLAAP